MRANTAFAVTFYATLACVAACGGTTDANDTPIEPRKSDSSLTIGAVVSKPVPFNPSIVSARSNLVAASEAPQIVYVSLLPGTVGDGTIATITDLRTQFTTTVNVFEGGFDPQALPAMAGDTIAITVNRTEEAAMKSYIVVNADAPPRPIRTNPPRGQTDVPVNARVTVVFSTPIAASSITVSSVTLSIAGNEIEGTAQVNPTSDFTVEFIPDAPLAQLTEYTLTVNTSVRDVTGRRLDSPVSVAFETAGPPDTSALTFSSISVNGNACGVTPAGKAYCWGANNWGQLGDGTYTTRYGAVPVSGGRTYSAISTSGSHTCALTPAGAAYCWGSNSYGQLGNGSFVPSSVPVLVPTTLAFTSITTMAAVTCAVTISHDAYCWGNGAYGALGSADLTNCASQACTLPMKVDGGLAFSSVSAGAYTVCGLTVTSAAYCWGQNTFGELGTGTTEGYEQCAYMGYPQNAADTNAPCSRTPVPVTGSRTFRTVGEGGFFGCALTDGGTAYCWGANNTGEFGNGATTGFGANPFPEVAAGGMLFREIVPGNQRICGIAMSGDAYCWGAHGAGENDQPSCLAGNGGCRSTVPALLGGGLAFTRLSVGTGTACGLTSAGEAYCWGANVSGGLGNNSTANRSTPVPVERSR